MWLVPSLLRCCRTEDGGEADVAHIEGEILIGRPVEEVFDFVADERNEPRFNARMARAELLSPEPIGVGSLFLAESRMMGRTVEITVEFTVFERPRLLGSRSSSISRGRQGRPLLTEGSLTFEPVPEGTRMCWSWDVETRGVLRLLSPLVARMGRRQEQTIWANLKQLLEAQQQLPPPSP
jgi:Polyketide cyclase / dehydrase and lipid transport